MNLTKETADESHHSNRNAGADAGLWRGHSANRAVQGQPRRPSANHAAQRHQGDHHDRRGKSDLKIGNDSETCRKRQFDVNSHEFNGKDIGCDYVKTLIPAIVAFLIAPSAEAATIDVAFLGEVTGVLGLGSQTVVGTGDEISIVVSIDADAATILDTMPLGGDRLIYYDAIVGISGSIGGFGFHQGPIPTVGTYGNAQVYNDVQLTTFSLPQDGFILTSSLNGDLINGFDPRGLTISMGTNVNTGVFSDASLGVGTFGVDVLGAMSGPSITLQFNTSAQSIFTNITSMQVLAPASVPIPLPGALLLSALWIMTRLRQPLNTRLKLETV